MLFHGDECSVDGATRDVAYDLKGVDSLANHSLSTSSNKF